MTHGSLFSGVGGFELGARNAGIETAWNCEIVEYNRKVLKKHFPETIQYEDIRALQNPPYVDIISGGFPCQDISIANQKDAKGIKGTRSGLWSEMCRIVGEVRPKYVFIENSSALLNRGFERVLCDLSEIGYCVEWKCLSAAQFGYCHKRERFYGIAYPEQVRRPGSNEVFRSIQEVLTKRPPRQSPISVPIKRFDSRSDYTHVRMDDGFSSQLDKPRIEAMGNAVIPEIAQYLFECVKLHCNQPK